jgi:putative solute:sodium symporter small subunit
LGRPACRGFGSVSGKSKSDTRTTGAIQRALLQRMGEIRMPQNNDEAHWKKTTNLMLMHLGLWVFFGYIVHMFVVPLNKIVIPILNFPLGFYMAAQGSLIAFVVMLFMFARQQDNIDREFGVAEDD